MSVLIVSHADSGGGAARAAYRLACNLNMHGLPAQILASQATKPQTVAIRQDRFKSYVGATLRNGMGSALGRLQKPADSYLRSHNVLPGKAGQLIAATPHDVVNLHWIGGEMISIEAIGRITKPVVWTMHDMWPFTGAEHCAPDDDAARWRHGYTRANRAPGSAGLDLDRLTWRRKLRAWRQPWHVVCPSRWLADCAQGSALMRDWPVHVVPNPLDLVTFRPWPRAMARQMLGLPADVLLIAFGAIGGTSDPLKGWDLLLPALLRVNQRYPDAQVIIFGQSEPKEPMPLAMKVNWTEHLTDDIALALVYSAADLVVVPSRLENLPQTSTEAQACGRPRGRSGWPNCAARWACKAPTSPFSWAASIPTSAGLSG